MDRKKLRRKPKLERRNAVKYSDYDAVSPSSSFDDSSASLYTSSIDFNDRTSFRIDGIEGEFDRICKSLGLSGPEDFSIPATAWEEMKVHFNSDILYKLNIIENDEKIVVVVGEEETKEIESEMVEECENRVRDDEPGEISGCCVGGIKGIRPLMLKPPPGMRVQVVDSTCSTWDLLREFAPQGEEQREVDKEKEEVGVEREEEEDNEEMIGEVISDELSSEDDSSSTNTNTDADPRSNNISPNARIKRTITTGKWQKGELLGRGSFGSVYEGISEDGFFFAVKEVSLLDQGSQGKQSVYQLEQEIALLSQFEHENIVQYYDTEMDESKLYIFLELVTKGSLARLYQRYTLRDSQVSAYTRQILHGLKYLHDRNVVHRDIKCANILVDANGFVKLADFGLAKATKLNDVKSCKGTAFWMAPEVVKGKHQGYGLPADMWSLGCTVLEMLTGQIPYFELECMQALFRIGKGEQPPIPDSLSRDAHDFITQCLQVNPDERPSAAQLLNHPFVQRPVSQSSGSSFPNPNIPGRKG
ncbi:hypothetical protein Lal_00001861 [Lupinus albus]|uniref:mitogen-activated protein kinase kinase kinase n=1 Tax=Lupinus albus TaxID=3870 RepID=A0A6A4PRL9_LUPAL|nr:putative mitogen-activated protein kinase kinase kinase STE-STE11 family [Lupinus albus]KAF1893392.1 hypothetical protein Lal_00001861 [Lupinus albus]